MPVKFIDLKGKRFGRLIVIQKMPSNNRGNVMWDCLCDCGKNKQIESLSLRRGSTKSCGCIWCPDDEEYMKKLERKLLDNHQKKDGCWIWKKATNKSGYGITKIRTKRIMTHRAAYIIWKGEIPKGYYVCHTCDQPSCINPDHLWVGTHTDNVRDMIKKERENFYGWHTKT